MRPGRWIGNRSRLPFSVVLSLRSQLLHQRMPTVLTVLALAASVGLPRHLTTGTLTADGALTTTLGAETSPAADLSGRIGLDARDGTIGRAVPAAKSLSPQNGGRAERTGLITKK